MKEMFSCFHLDNIKKYFKIEKYGKMSKKKFIDFNKFFITA